MGRQSRESPRECKQAEKQQAVLLCGQEEVNEPGKTIQGIVMETLTRSSHLPAWEVI